MNRLSRYLFLLVLFLFCTQLRAQEKKLWVLIIGISDYQYFNSLQYADDDALSFYKFLKTNYGDKIDDSDEGNARILLNQEATGASITSAFSWLVRNAKSGDDVIIYFSGHGAQEEITSFKLGYLVGHDCFDQSYSNGGTMPMFYLQKILETLSINDVNTIFFADACHAGKKDGESDNLEHLNTVLSGEIGKITKILAAQGKELSWEDTRWGGGHGVFTYYLIQGLTGGADTDPVDQVITVRELNNFLDSKIPKDTDYQQNPRVISQNRNTALARIDSIKLTDLRKEFTASLDDLDNYNLLASRSLEVTIKDNDLKNLYIELKSQVNNKEISESFKTYSAIKSLAKGNALLQDDFQKIKPDIIDRLYAMSMDYSQRYINRFMENDHFDKSLDTLSNTLAHSSLTQILDDIERNDFRYNQLKTKQYFFKGEIKHDEYHGDKLKKRELKSFIDDFVTVLPLDSNAAYLQYQAGVLYYHIGENNIAEKFAKKASALAPHWSYPQNSLGNIYSEQKKGRSSLDAYLKGLSISRIGSPVLYQNIQSAYWDLKKYDSVNYYVNLQLTDNFRQAQMREQEIDSLWNLMFVDGAVNDVTVLRKIKNGYEKKFRVLELERWSLSELEQWSAYKKTKNKNYYKMHIRINMLQDKLYSIVYNLKVRLKETDQSSHDYLDKVFNRFLVYTPSYLLWKHIDLKDTSYKVVPYYKYRYLKLKGKGKKADKYLVELKQDEHWPYFEKLINNQKELQDQ